MITLVLAILIGKRQNITVDMSDDSTATTEEVSPSAVPEPLEDDAPVEMPTAPVETPAPTPPAEPSTGSDQ